MAATTQLSLFFLFTLLSSLQIHARSVQMFNKVPSQTNENVVKETDETFNTKETQHQQQNNFIPENENSYGLYGHESGQLPPSTTTTTTTTTNNNNNNNNNFPYNAKYLPKNYNTVAYVTQPEDFSDTTTTTTENNNNYYNGGNKYYNGHRNGVKYPEFVDREFTATDNENNYYNNGVNNYNSQEKGFGDTRFMDTAYTTTTTTNNNNNNNNNYYNGGRVSRVQPQGLSDTRFLDNGKYYYDINSEKFSRNPYDNSREFGQTNNENLYQNNFMEGQERFQDEENMP